MFELFGELAYKTKKKSDICIFRTKAHAQFIVLRNQFSNYSSFKLFKHNLKLFLFLLNSMNKFFKLIGSVKLKCINLLQIFSWFRILNKQMPNSPMTKNIRPRSLIAFCLYFCIKCNSFCRHESIFSTTILKQNRTSHNKFIPIINNTNLDLVLKTLNISMYTPII